MLKGVIKINDEDVEPKQVCSTCKELKPLKEFGKSVRKLSGVQNKCRICSSTYRIQLEQNRIAERNKFY